MKFTEFKKQFLLSCSIDDTYPPSEELLKEYWKKCMSVIDAFDLWVDS